jgi:hypothetical protein
MVWCWSRGRTLPFSIWKWLQRDDNKHYFLNKIIVSIFICSYIFLEEGLYLQANNSLYLVAKETIHTYLERANDLKLKKITGAFNALPSTDMPSWLVLRYPSVLLCILLFPLYKT